MAERVLPCCITITTFLIVILFACCPVVRAYYCGGREGEVRLADRPSSREGRVDICVNGCWLTPCQDTWGIEETRVVCRELGFCQQGGSLVTGKSYQGYIPNYINEINCTGDEATLSNCSVTYYSSNCGSYAGAGVSCNSTQPNIPTNVEITGIDSYSIRVTWSPPDMSNCADVDEYKIYCFDYSYCGNYYNFREETPSHFSSVTLYDPYDNDNFDSLTFFCCVSGNNSAGQGPQYCMRGPRPTPLRNVTVQPSQTSLLIEWMEPEQVYGQFNFYIVVCGTQTRPGVSSRIVYSITETAVNFTRLSVFTRYECCVRVYNYNFIDSIPNCMIATTAPDLPTAPLAVNVTELTYKSIQLEWSPPQPANGIISHYTITCLQADGTVVRLNTTADGLETVSNLQPLTNYTCCISATNQAGEGNDTCVDARTNGRNHSRTKNEHQHTTRSKSPHTTNEQKVNTSEQKQKVNTSVVLYGNKPDKQKKMSTYTLPKEKNVFKSTKNTETPPIPTRRYLKDDDFIVRNFDGQPAIPSRATIMDQVSAGPQRSDDEPAVPPHVQLLDNAFVQGLETVAEVSGKDALDLGDKDKKIYQPLISPRRYDKDVSDVHQALISNRDSREMAFQTKEIRFATDSESHYQPLVKRAEQSVYEMVTVGGGKDGENKNIETVPNNFEGHYQPLMKREEPGDYQPISTCISGPGQTLTSSAVMQSESNSEEGHYQALVRKQEENTYQSLTLHRVTVV